MLKICQTLLMTIYNITSNIKKIVQQLMFMIKCLNGFVIKWTDKINHLGHIMDVGQIPPGQKPPGQKPPGQKKTRHNPSRTKTTLDKNPLLYLV